jgi:hypothetical protein
VGQGPKAVLREVVDEVVDGWGDSEAVEEGGPCMEGDRAFALSNWFTIPSACRCT